MDTGIGATLREARSRRKVGLSEAEEATKIRLRYLRAMENEEWDALPGGPYTRSFIRTYASFLGLDGERLADEYRRDAEGAPVPRTEPALPSPRPQRRGSSSFSTRTWTAIVSACLVAAVVAIGLSTGGGNTLAPPPAHRQRGAFHARAIVPVTPKPRGVSVSLAAQAEIWVCLIDSSGKRLVDGQILGAGTRAGPFHSSSFKVSFGNGEFSMKIDGQMAKIPATSSPIGYSIDSSGRLEKLPETERPTCS